MMHLRSLQSVALMALLLTGITHVQALTLTLRDASSGEPLADAVITVPASGPAEPLPEPAVMAQENRAFVPHLLVIPRGSRVEFPNRDNTQHHVYSFSRPHPFNIALYAGHPEAPIVFDKPGVIELGCNIHDRMQAFIFVTPSAQTVTTGAQGQATITPPGDSDFQITVWHERLLDNTVAQTVSVENSASGLQQISLEVSPPQADTDPFADLQRRFDSL